MRAAYEGVIMDFTNRLNNIKTSLKEAERECTVLETEQAASEKQLAEVVLAMTEAGVTPETAEAEIERLKGEIETGLTKMEGLLSEI